MQKKGAQMIDITNKNIQFNLGDLHFELLNTDIDPQELNYGENQNSLVTLINFRNTKILLASDMLAKDDKIFKDYIGEIDILKLAHHGKSESSYDFLKVAQPNYVIISNSKIPNYANQLINYLKYSLNSKIYLTEYVSKSSESVENSSIILNLNKEGPEYQFINTGKEVEPDYSLEGWFSWCDKKTYIKSGITVKGWQNLEWNGATHTFYFLPENGTLVQNKCIDIDGKNYCFDENGYLISG